MYLDVFRLSQWWLRLRWFGAYGGGVVVVVVAMVMVVVFVCGTYGRKCFSWPRRCVRVDVFI